MITALTLYADALNPMWTLNGSNRHLTDPLHSCFNVDHSKQFLEYGQYEWGSFKKELGMQNVIDFMIEINEIQGAENFSIVEESVIWD